MWKRRTFHECAASLRETCSRFRAAYLGHEPMDEVAKARIMTETSVQGIEVLRALALAVRSEQDYGLLQGVAPTVGALKKDATPGDLQAFLAFDLYRPPYSALTGFEPLPLREGLNKIAHADPTAGSAFHVADDVHDIVITGTLGQRRWLAVISLLDVVTAIGSLPDVQLQRAV